LHLEKFRSLLAHPPSKLCDMNSFQPIRRKKSKQHLYGEVPTRTLNCYNYPSDNKVPKSVNANILSYVYGDTSFSLDFLPQCLTATNVQYPKCLHRIRPSDYNPPPGNRKLRGDILFIEVVTLEGETLFLTAGADGFFINKSTVEKFNPEPRMNPYIKDSTLVGLLLEVSPLFRVNYRNLLSMASQAHPFANLCLPFPITEWCTKVQEHTTNCARAEKFLVDNFGAELRAPQRDWNEEYQSLRSIGQNTVEDRIIRDRSVFRFYVDFVHAAHRGAKAIIEGAIPPLNPMDPQRSFVYVFNCIFFSLAVDARNQYQEADGDMTAYKMSSHDIKGLRAVQNLGASNANGVHLLATCLVDYCGQRVVAQALIPGILHGEQTESLVYGSIDLGQQFCFHEEFHQKLSELGKLMGWKAHKAYDQNENEIELIAAAESKGIIGSDRRLYLLDLIRCFPRDPNFAHPQKGVDKLLRPEIIRSFEEKLARQEKVNQNRNGNNTFVDNYFSADEKEEENEIESPRIPRLMLNVNCLCRVNLVDTEEDSRVLNQISDHLFESIEKLAANLCATDICIVDNQNLCEIFHSKGINMRYLGKVCELCSEHTFLKLILEREMIVRAAKEVFCKVMMRLSEGGRQAYYEKLHHDSCSNVSTISTIVRMFLNAVLGKHFWMKGISAKMLKKAKKINKMLLEQHQHFLKNCSSLLTEDPFYSLRFEKRRVDVSDGSDHVFFPANVWQQIQETIYSKFKYQFQGKNARVSIDTKYCIARSLCKKIGVQITCREYDWNTNEPFNDTDIQDMFHTVKAAVPECSHATQMTERAKRLLESNQVEVAYENLQNVMSLTQAVYGPAHPKTVQVHSLLALAAYRLRNYEEAIENQKRATTLSERVHGISNYQTAEHYSVLALFCNTGGLHEKAFQYISRSIYLHELIGGKQNIATCLQILNLATLHLDHGHYDKALEIYQKVKATFTDQLHPEHTRIAQCEHFIALCYGLSGKLDVAYKHECRANEIFKLNKLNPSKYWTKKFTMPVPGEISSSESEGYGSSSRQSEGSPLEWFCKYKVRFRGRLAAFTLINRLKDLRKQCRTRLRHEPILRTSPDYKPRRSIAERYTSPSESTSGDGEDSKSSSVSSNPSMPNLKLPRQRRNSTEGPRRRKIRNRGSKAKSLTPEIPIIGHFENLEKIQRKITAQDALVQKLLMQLKKDPCANTQNTLRNELKQLKTYKSQAETIEAVLQPTTNTIQKGTKTLKKKQLNPKVSKKLKPKTIIVSKPNGES